MIVRRCPRRGAERFAKKNPMPRLIEQPKKRVTLTVGEQLDFRMRSNPTTGCNWQVSDCHSSIIAKEAQFESQSDSEKIGGGGFQHFHVTVDKPGAWEIVFEYKQPWEDKVQDEWKVELVATARES